MIFIIILALCAVVLLAALIDIFVAERKLNKLVKEYEDKYRKQ